MRANGLDVSHYHPVLDWGALTSPTNYAAGFAAPTFICVKATEGNSVVDPKLREHREGFRASSMLLGIYYHFARSGNPRVQATRFMDVVGPLDPRERLCLDLEVAPAKGPEAVRDWVADFYSVIMRSDGLSFDRRPFIYTSERAWRELAGNQTWVAGSMDVDLWAPRYNNAGREPLLPPPWANRGWRVWQWTDGQEPPHELPGVGECDGSVWSGGEDDLRAYMKTSLFGSVPPGAAP